MNTLPSDHHEKAPSRVWKQLENKLELNRKKKKIRQLRTVTAIAACFVLLLGLGYYNLSLKPHNPNIFATNHAFQSFVFEQLEIADMPVYDQDQLRILNREVLKKNPDFLK